MKANKDQPIGQQIKDCAANPATRSFWIAVAILSAAFIKPLSELVSIALNTELYSHIPLIPLVSIYFAWTTRQIGNARPAKQPAFALSITIAGTALALLAFYFLNRESDAFAYPDNYLAITILPFVLLIAAVGIYFFGVHAFRRHLFSFGFLLFTVPMPLFLQDGINTFFQYTSAEASHALLSALQVPVFREQPLVFQLPNITLQVAPECSGIRSSLVLLITSIVGGKLFLESKLNRAFLALFIVPLAIARNGLRIATIGYLCTNYGPHMIDSWVHHRGGPLFFALSLGPFFLFLLWVWKQDRKRTAKALRKKEA